MATHKKSGGKAKRKSTLVSDSAYDHLRSHNKPARKVYSYPANGLPTVKQGAKTSSFRTSFLDAR